MSADTRHAAFLFLAYFHEDCLEEDPDWEAVVLRYRSSEAFEIVRQTRDELVALLGRSTEADLESFLFGPGRISCYDPRLEGLTLRAWLEEIVHLLAGGTAVSPDRAAISHSRREAVRIARRVLAGGDPILATRELTALRGSVDVPQDDADFNCFTAIDSETDALPVGHQSKLWSPDSLAALEPEIATARERALSVGREAFQNVVRRFSGAG